MAMDKIERPTKPERLAIPVGGSPTKTGGSPVLPTLISELGRELSPVKVS
jgi:hypothetical protein